MTVIPDDEQSMTFTLDITEQRLIALDKTGGREYLSASFAAWRAGDLLLPVSPGGAPPDVGLPIRERIVPQTGGGWFDEVISLDLSDTPAQITMTSGTTGNPKAILLSRRALSDVTHRLIDIMALDGTVREYLGVPVTYSFGLGRARAIATVGGAAYLPAQGFRADELAAMLEAGEVNSLSAVPTLLRLVLAQRSLFDTCGTKLRWLEIGSQYMSGAEKDQVRKLFPDARIVQHYGLTEASRSTFLRIDGAPASFLESVGKPTGDVQIRLNDDNLICIRGPNVALGQLVNGEVCPITDSQGWLCTNDRGELKDGLLFYKGRSDDVVNVGGVKISTEHFEQRIMNHLPLYSDRIAVAGRIDPLRGQGVMIAHLPDVDHLSLTKAAHAAAADSGLGAADVSLVQVDLIPRTETGKVQRQLLAERYGQSRSAERPDTLASPPTDGQSWLSAREVEIAAIWCEALGLATIRRDDSFFEIGGDSLSAVTVALLAEQRGAPREVMALMFEGRTIAEIAAALDRPGIAVSRSGVALLGDTINVARGLLVLLVVMSHWGPAVFERLGDVGAATQAYGELLFSLGTPGFAMIFGVGLSFFYIPAFKRFPNQIWSKVLSNTTLLFGGVVVIALLNGIQLLLAGGFDDIWPEKLFFSIILSYFLIVPTVPFILRIVQITPEIALNALIMAACALLSVVVFQTLLPDQLTGFANLIRLMLITPYGYPQVAAAAFIGIAIGSWLQTNSDDPFLTRKCLHLSLLCILGGVVILIYTGGIWSHLREPQFLVLFAGVLLLIIGSVRQIVGIPSAQVAMRPLILIGLLAFPAYIGHGMVIPIKDILVLLGVPYGVALGLAFGSFIAGALYAMTRLKRIYYPKLASP